MATVQGSIKRGLIDKANSTIVASTAAAAFIVVFSVVASIALASQLKYQNHIITAKKQAVTQLKTDLNNTKSLVSSYKAFVSTSQNIIGGNPNGSGAQDGDNGKIVLDSLPGAYDFPALATSLEKVLGSQNVKIQSITGTDDEVAQSNQQSNSNTQPVPIPFQFSVSGDYQSIQNVSKALEASIRPVQVQLMDISGGQGNLTLSVTAQTFYQPEKSLNIATKVVK